MASHTVFEKEDSLVTCPYNRHHRVSREKLRYHMNRCVRSQDTSGKRICPFNSTHVFDCYQYANHVENCPDKGILEKHKYDEGTPGSARQKQKDFSGVGVTSSLVPKWCDRDIGSESSEDKLGLPIKNVDVLCEENWDDIDVPTYNPMIKVEQDPSLLHFKKGAIPSERKKYVNNRKKEFNKFNNSRDMSSSQSECSSYCGDDELSGIELPQYEPRSSSFALPNNLESPSKRRTDEQRSRSQFHASDTDAAGPSYYEPRSETAWLNLPKPSAESTEQSYSKPRTDGHLSGPQIHKPNVGSAESSLYERRAETAWLNLPKPSAESTEQSYSKPRTDDDHLSDSQLHRSDTSSFYEQRAKTSSRPSLPNSYAETSFPSLTKSDADQSTQQMLYSKPRTNGHLSKSQMQRSNVDQAVPSWYERRADTSRSSLNKAKAESTGQLTYFKPKPYPDSTSFFEPSSGAANSIGTWSFKSRADKNHQGCPAHQSSPDSTANKHLATTNGGGQPRQPRRSFATLAASSIFNTTDTEEEPNFQNIRSAVNVNRAESVAWNMVKREPTLRRTPMMYDEGDGSECGSSPPRAPRDYRSLGFGRGAPSRDKYL